MKSTNPPHSPLTFKRRIFAMMNGPGVRSVLVRNRGENGSASMDGVPHTVQFDESSDEYRCLCNCFHIKTGAYIIAGVHALMLLFFLIYSLLVYFQHDERYQHAVGVQDNFVFGSFLAEVIGLAIGTIVVFLLLIGVTRNTASLLVPHIVVQVISIICFALLLISGTIALSTDSAVFYRFLNAAPFIEHPQQNTVALDTATLARIYAMLVIYAVSLLLEIWFVIVIYNCHRYLDERGAYMKYCLAFSTPMKTLSAR